MTRGRARPTSGGMLRRLDTTMALAVSSAVEVATAVLDDGGLAASVLDTWAARARCWTPTGGIILVNRAWRRFAADNGGDPDAAPGNYLQDAVQR